MAESTDRFLNLKFSSKSNVLECRVCEDVFSLQGEKVPRLLYCGHTVCHSCLVQLPLRDNLIQCPFDRQSTPTGNSGVWGLKKNFALLELLERLELTHKNDSTFTSQEIIERETQLAVKCDENEIHMAVLYCTVCATNLCVDCSDFTHATRTLQRHRRVLLSDKPKEKPKCSSHPSHVAEFTCLEEECKFLVTPGPLMCFICKDYGRHKNHKHSLIEAEADTIRTSVSTAVARIQLFIESMNDTICKLEQTIQNMEGTDSQPGTGLMAKARVRVHFEDLREDLKLQEQTAMTAVDTHLRERLCSLRQMQQDLSTSLAQVASVCVQCDQTLQQDDIKVVLSARELEEALICIDKTQAQFSELSPDQLQPDPCIPITFTKDNRVHIGPKIEMRVVTLGLDGAGKTSILFKLKQNEFMTMIPTIGFNVETIEYKNIKFTIWDVGGQTKLRPLWKHYYFNTQAVVFVMDSSDSERLVEAHTELLKLLTEKELKDAAFLILANKQDVENCMSIETITEGLSLHKLCCGRSWHLEACSSQTGQGLVDGLDWLAMQLVASGVYDVT